MRGCFVLVPSDKFLKLKKKKIKLLDLINLVGELASASA